LKKREPAIPTGSLRLLFIGQLIHRKGVDVLLNALHRMNDVNAHLTIVGTGKLECDLKNLAHSLGLGDVVTFRGGVANNGLAEIFASHDVLVLPSRFDGWGAVVNEAMLAGLPVICSDRCGASDLIKGSGVPGVFRSEDPKSLVDELIQIKKLLTSSEVQVRESLQSWSESFEGPSVGEYLEDIIENVNGRKVRPLAPWFASSAVLKK
jgi:glycosyltransferase involved in cell wall biosynthesis